MYSKLVVIISITKPKVTSVKKMPMMMYYQQQFQQQENKDNLRFGNGILSGGSL